MGFFQLLIGVAGALKFRPMTLPDVLIDHDSPARQMVVAKLTARDIADTVLAALGRETGALRA